MKKSLQILLLLSSFLIHSGCVTLKNFEKTSTQLPKLSAVLGNKFKTALYKTTIDIGERHLTGLFYFKNFQDSSLRVVFMSEIGLNYFDFEFKKDSFKVVSCQEFIRKKMILNTLQNDIKLLVTFPENTSKKKYYKNTQDQSGLLKTKYKSNKYFIFYNQHNQITKVIQKKGLKRVDLLINDSSEIIPQNMEIYHKKMKLRIKFNLLKLK